MLIALGVVASLGFAAVSLAANPDYMYGEHSYGGKKCTYHSYAAVNWPSPATALAYTGIDTPSCQNGYSEVWAYVARTDSTIWYGRVGWVVGTANWYYSTPNACQMVGYQHRISIAGVDTSPNLTANTGWTC